MSTVRRPAADEIIRASRLLSQLAEHHGLGNLRLGEPGQLVVDAAEAVGYFAFVAFEDDVERALGWRPEVVSAGAPDAMPGQPVSTAA